MYARGCVCVRACVYVCVCVLSSWSVVNTCTHTHTGHFRPHLTASINYAHINTYIQTNRQTDRQTNKHTDTQTHTHTQILSDLISHGIDLHSYIEAVSTSRQTTAKLEFARPPYAIPAYLTERPDFFAQALVHTHTHNHSFTSFRGLGDDICGTADVDQETRRETANLRGDYEVDATAATGGKSMMLGGDATGLSVHTCTNGFTVVTLKGTCDDIPRKWPPDNVHAPECRLPKEAAAAASWTWNGAKQVQGDVRHDAKARDHNNKRPVLISSLWAPSGQSEACPNQSCVEKCRDTCVWVDAEAGAEACALSGYADLVLHTTESVHRWNAVVKPQRQVWAVVRADHLLTLQDHDVHADSGSSSDHVHAESGSNGGSGSDSSRHDHKLSDSDSNPDSWEDSESETLRPFDFSVHDGTFPGVFGQRMDACKLCEHVRMRVSARCASPPHTLTPETTPPHVLIMLPQAGHSLERAPDTKFMFRTEGFEIGVDGHIVVQLLGKHEFTAVVTVEDQNNSDLVYPVAEGVLQWALPLAGLGDIHVCVCVSVHIFINTCMSAAEGVLQWDVPLAGLGDIHVCVHIRSSIHA